MVENKKKNETPTTVCLPLKKSLEDCISEPSSDLHDPTARNKGKSGCSRSISNHLKKVMIHRSKRRQPPENPADYRPTISTGGKTGFILTENEGLVGNDFSSVKREYSQYTNGEDGVAKCCKCGQQFVKWEDLESHHLSNHAVTELADDNSSRKIVEIICGSSQLKSERRCLRIHRVLKIHNMQKTLARFEDYRETVKIKANSLPIKHPRCLADGNEHLRFYGAILECSLGVNGSSGLCASEKCCVCRIIENGFSAKMEIKLGIMAVYTTSTSERAFQSIEIDCESETTLMRKALIVCRVIAGRIYRSLDNVLETSGHLGFDSLAGKVGLCSDVEELYLLTPEALLPCFVVICKT